MKAILVPIDFSPSSINSANYAIEVAKLDNAKVILLHVCSVPMPSTDIPTPVIPFIEAEKQCMEELEDLKKTLTSEHKNVEIALMVRTGFVAEEILLAAQERADLIIMAITEKSKSAEIFGSNTSVVMKKSHCPVLAIPAKIKFKKPEKMALACDYKVIMPDSVVKKMKYFINLFGSKFLVFDVLKPAEVITYQKATAEVNLENSLGGIEHSLYFPSGNSVEEQTDQFVEKNKVDLLIVVPHNYIFLQKLFHVSKTVQLALHTKVPLLSIHE